MVEDGLPDFLGGHDVAQESNLFLDSIGNGLDGGIVEHTALRGDGDPPHDGTPVEIDPAPITLADDQLGVLEAFEGGEAVAALTARTPATDGPTFVCGARIDDPRVIGIA